MPKLKLYNQQQLQAIEAERILCASMRVSVLWVFGAGSSQTTNNITSLKMVC